MWSKIYLLKVRENLSVCFSLLASTSAYIMFHGEKIQNIQVEAHDCGVIQSIVCWLSAIVASPIYHDEDSFQPGLFSDGENTRELERIEDTHTLTPHEIIAIQKWSVSQYFKTLKNETVENI